MFGEPCGSLEKLVAQLQDTEIAELGMNLETRAERQVSVVDMLETTVQETQKVVANLDNSFAELEDDLELRVDEIAKSVLIVPWSFRFWHVLSRTWSNGVRSRIVTYDRHARGALLVLSGAPPAQGGIQILGTGNVSVTMPDKFQQSSLNCGWCLFSSSTELDIAVML